MIRNKIVTAAYPVSVHFKRLLINGLDISVIVPLNNGKNETLIGSYTCKSKEARTVLNSKLRLCYAEN